MIRRGLCVAAMISLLAFAAAAQPPNSPVPSVFDPFPVPPSGKSSLFYIQRNKNANAIVYEAVTDATGKLSAKAPVRVQWIRYTEGGHRKDLSLLESNIAYGVRFKGMVDDHANMVFVASDKFPFQVFVNSDGQAEARMMIDGHYARLNHVRVQADEESWWPRILYVDIIGTDLSTKLDVTQHYIP